MATDLSKSKRKPKALAVAPEPTWEIARLFPDQGDWTEGDYFALDTNQRVEYSDGVLEFLPIPTVFHQLILPFLYAQLKACVDAGGLGTVVIAGYKVRLRRGKYREPDIVFIATAHRDSIRERYCERADLVIEVVSGDKRAHDLKTKRAEYARSGIPEYWIVDPQLQTITVLVHKTKGKPYREHGVFRMGEIARSKLLPGFIVEVTEALSQRP
jgi:Uma2 family endonuclease